jgi:hypothetical protein
MAKPKAFIDVRSPKISFGLGALTGMVIIASPEIIGAALIMSILVLTLKLVEQGRM